MHGCRVDGGGCETSYSIDLFGARSVHERSATVYARATHQNTFPPGLMRVQVRAMAKNKCWAIWPHPSQRM
eukprot:scaffold33958_cov28-Tisochrysis_lutea.AAC.3